MLGYDQFDTLAERLFGRIAKQRGTGWVPANDRSRVVGKDDSVSDLIENSLRQFGLLFHGCTPWMGTRRSLNPDQPNDEKTILARLSWRLST
jgi:hypothetical protein